jgi:lysyl-tRNA synthetase class 2
MSSDEQEQTLRRIMGERREKARRLASSGNNPYRNDLGPTHDLAAIHDRYDRTKPAADAPAASGPPQPIDGEVVRLCGRVMARRGFGKTVFVPIRDGAGDLQLFLAKGTLADADFDGALAELDIGDIVAAEGALFWTKKGELSLLATKLAIVTKSLRPLPDKWHGLTDVELRYRQRWLDLAVNPEVRDVFRKRSQIVRGIRRFLDDRRFLEVETPMMHPIIGGAAAKPFVTHHNALDMRLYLRIAPELYLKRLVVGGFERVYEINRNFRNEGLSRQHNPEFTMLEFYQAYATYQDLMVLTEEMVGGLAQEINGTTRTTWDGDEIELAAPWKRLSVRDAVAQAGASAEVWDDPTVAAAEAVRLGTPSDEVLRGLAASLDAAALGALDPEGAAGLVRRFRDAAQRPAVARAIAERYADRDEGRVRAGQVAFTIFEQKIESTLIQPTFLHGFPLAVSPLARKNDVDPAFCDRFELFVGGREIANAFSELNDPDDQRSRFQAQLIAREAGADETMDYDEDYCRALELGMPPAAGEGVGIDRLAMLLTGQPSIRDVILFPQMRAE